MTPLPLPFLVPSLPSHLTAVLEIDTQIIVQNYQTLCARLPTSTCAAVLKADAYGFGIDPVAPLLFQEGCRHFFVAHLEEAIRLRQLLDSPAIYVFSGLLPHTEAYFNEHRLTPILNDFAMVQAWANEALKQDRAQPCLLHIDTGMRRNGFDAQDVTKLLRSIDLLERLDVHFVMSHLVSSQDPLDPLNGQQKELFDRFLSHFPRTQASLADTGGAYLSPSFHYDMVRAGKGLFGLYTPPPGSAPLMPCLTLRGRILQVRTAHRGESVGYGASHTLTRDSKLATLGIGFGDGYDRRLSNTGYVLIQGMKAPIVGRISMDYTVVDVTDIPETFYGVGTWAECVNETLTLDTLAHTAGTISREFSTGFNTRLHRVYV